MNERTNQGVDCADALRQIYTYLDGELTDERRAAIAGHLGACVPCSGGFDFEVELRELVASRCREAAPPELRERIARAITELDQV